MLPPTRQPSTLQMVPALERACFAPADQAPDRSLNRPQLSCILRLMSPFLQKSDRIGVGRGLVGIGHRIFEDLFEQLVARRTSLAGAFTACAASAQWIRKSVQLLGQVQPFAGCPVPSADFCHAILTPRLVTTPTKPCSRTTRHPWRATKRALHKRAEPKIDS